MTSSIQVKQTVSNINVSTKYQYLIGIPIVSIFTGRFFDVIIDLY